ncbi:MAG: type IV secretory system conjugative DNA transfer family protein [Eubacteriaceae bacterium]|nr:type IV secretory system conjugative DNA transfer family protein [Eubacteriaceae bacterium]
MGNISKKAIWALMASIVCFYIVNKAVYAFNCSDGTAIDKTLSAFALQSLVNSPLSISFGRYELFFSGIASFTAFAISLQPFSAGHQGKEYGTARWGQKHDIAPLKNPEFSQNILLTSTEWISINGRPSKRGRASNANRNANVMVIGGSGSGKSRYAIKPQIAQMNASYIVTDPKGQLFHETAGMLQENGYKISVLNLVERDKTSYYNPFKYIKTADDILKLINNIIKNTNPPEQHSQDPFWEKSETALLEAIFGYIVMELPEEERDIETAMQLLANARGDESQGSTLDFLFEILKEKNPDHFAVKQYEIFKFAAPQTAQSILVSVGVRLAPFNIESISKIFSKDTLSLDTLGDEKRALYIIISDTDTSFSFIAAMVFQQLFDSLIRKADSNSGGRLKVPVMCLLDEFANIGQIPGFPTLISTIRSRNIGAMICLQGLSQLKAMYEKNWETITGNCDSLLYLGGMEQATIKYISEMCGKQTISSQSTSQSRGGESGSFSVSKQSLGRELITEGELATLAADTCILKISRLNPFLSRKYPLEKHPNYKLLADYDSSKYFRFEDIKKQ